MTATHHPARREELDSPAPSSPTDDTDTSTWAGDVENGTEWGPEDAEINRRLDAEMVLFKDLRSRFDAFDEDTRELMEHRQEVEAQLGLGELRDGRPNDMRTMEEQVRAQLAELKIGRQNDVRTMQELDELKDRRESHFRALWERLQKNKITLRDDLDARCKEIQELRKLLGEETAEREEDMESL